MPTSGEEFSFKYFSMETVENIKIAINKTLKVRKVNGKTFTKLQILDIIMKGDSARLS